MMRLEAGVKRLVDLLGSGLLLMVCLPLMALVALSLNAVMGRPTLFRQRRPGLRGEPFEILKFRTMSASCDGSGIPLSDGERLTRLGRLLRRSSLDELPELWNVLRGDMSLVGPRPLLMEYLDRYTPQQMRRHEVKPGITGLAQVSGRNDLPWEERLAVDVWYVDNWSLWLDLKILAMTVWQVLSGRGVSAAGHATMPEFRGGGD